MKTRSILLLVSAALLLVSVSATAEVILNSPRDLHRLPNGHTLIMEGGSGPMGEGSFILEVDANGALVAAWLADLHHGHNAEPTGSNTLIVTDTFVNRIVELDATGAIIWNSDDVSPFSDGSTLGWPNDANLLANGNLLITDRDGARCFEMDRLGNVVWQFGETGVEGSDLSHMRDPHNADRLPNGNTIVADSNNNRILEVDIAGVVQWEYSPTGADALDLPRDADRLDNGNTLITDTQNHRIVEVDPAGNVVWQYGDGTLNVIGFPYEADRLANGNTLLSDGFHKQVVEVDAAGQIVWQYPGLVQTTFDVELITNPTSGVDLFTHIHRPVDDGSGRTYPVVVLIPGGNGAGGSFHNYATTLASEGIVAVHFDPDGRGLSTNGGTYTTEDYCGHLHQDGLKAVLDVAVAQSDADRNSVGIFSRSYGVTMASGMLARYPDQPPVRWLLDWEGPANRGQTAAVNGGHVPISPSNNAFWAEREADTFMADTLVQYTRLQTEVDHNLSITDNIHAISLINAATHDAYGGDGAALWTRVNRGFDNAQDTTYSVATPAVWLDEALNVFSPVIETLLMRERIDAPTMVVGGDLSLGGNLTLDWDLGPAMGNQLYWIAFSFGHGPIYVPYKTTLHLDLDILFDLTFFGNTLGPSGTAGLSILLPTDPILVGTYYAQAAYLHPNSVTGISVTTGVEVVIQP
jgi:dienelactone hydrolase